MPIQTRTSGNVTILDMTGQIGIGAGDAELRQAVRDALDAGQTNLLLDLGGVTAIDSSGIGELVASYTRVSYRGGKLKLVAVPTKVVAMLKITQLISVFEIYDTQQEALDAF